MSLSDYVRLKAPVEGQETAPDGPRRGAPQHPQGWEPGVVLEGSEGVLTTGQVEDADPRWDSYLKEWGFSPEDFEVLDPITVKVWDGWAKIDGEIASKRMWSYKANIRRRSTTHRVDVEELIQEIRRHKPRKKAPPTGEQAFVVCLSDWQLGVGNGGDYEGPGSEAIVERILATGDAVTRRVRELRRLGRPLGSLYVFGLGDLVEGCSEFYAMQTHQVDLDRRDQVKIVRRLLRDLIARWAKDFDRVVVACVAGNHGENRKNGKSFTTFNDNDDVAVFEQVAEIFAANPETYGHVSFVIPSDRLHITLDVAGTIVALTHGHLARTSGIPQAKVLRWWADQCFGGADVGDASLLLTGHYHHLAITCQGGRTHVQVPAMDNGSRWFTDTSGLWAPTGTVTLVVGDGNWSDLEVV